MVPPFWITLHEVDTSFAYCGAALIAPTVVMTAASCAKSAKWATVGTSSGVRQVVAITDRTIHPKYASDKSYDLALLHLAVPSPASPIQMASSNWSAVDDDKSFWIRGFQSTNFNISLTTRQANLVSKEDCGMYFKTFETELMVCTTSDRLNVASTGGPLTMTIHDVEYAIGVTLPYAVEAADDDITIVPHLRLDKVGAFIQTYLAASKDLVPMPSTSPTPIPTDTSNISTPFPGFPDTTLPSTIPTASPTKTPLATNVATPTPTPDENTLPTPIPSPRPTISNWTKSTTTMPSPLPTFAPASTTPLTTSPGSTTSNPPFTPPPRTIFPGTFVPSTTVPATSPTPPTVPPATPSSPTSSPLPPTTPVPNKPSTTTGPSAPPTFAPTIPLTTSPATSPTPPTISTTSSAPTLSPITSVPSKYLPMECINRVF
ncbi:Aste57867_7913 [Aphanomyces stellatus]|uniref:Aste57867_7913 protein n=1 Tax=Aphanomyces stellatus TaxID=120398 RepID=A0A485KIY9_9STRA|nr:hypothetical protein As57867_007883 [Aphanomyces stellatus]VFT84806.1 Aste57867_7913 [Aphanomyces stellatus]